MLPTLPYLTVKYLMAKNSLYKKLVRQFEFSINNYQNVNAELDFAKLRKIILIQKKHNRYYRAIRRFSVYLKEYQDKNKLISISHKSRKKYQHLLEKIELIGNPLGKKKRWSIIAATVKKSIINPLVEISQSLFYMIFFSQLFTKQITTARPLQASRYTRQTNNCEHANADQCNETLDMAVYQDDLQKSMDFSEILNRKQSIEFKFKDTIFILTNDCISRRSLNNNPQSLCRSDYVWFLESMAIYLIKKKVRAEAQKQGLSLNEVDVAQITQDICSIDPMQQNNRQLIGIYSHGTILEKISGSKLEQFSLNAKYLSNTFQSIPHGKNSNNLISRVNRAVRLKIMVLKNLEPEESNLFTLLNRDHYSRPFPETQSAISNVLQIDINTPSTTFDQPAENFNWKIIASAAAGGIFFIVIIVAFIIWYSKKNRSENSGLGTEHAPLLNSISDNLHVLQIAGRLTKRLELLKNLDRYEEEIGIHYISFLSVRTKEEAIKNLKKIKESLIKFITFEKAKLKNNDIIILYKLESALLIVESLMQRNNLLSLPNINCSKNNYIPDRLKSCLKDSINSMLDNIEIIRFNFGGNFFNKHNIKKDGIKLHLDLLINLEKAIYETMLFAHAEGYFEKYPRELIKNCLDLNDNTNPVINNKSDLKKIKELQGDLISSLGFIINPSKLLDNALLKLNEDTLHNAIDCFIKKLESIKSQLVAYFADYNARLEEASKLKQTQTSVGSANSAFFRHQLPPAQNQTESCAEIFTT